MYVRISISAWKIHFLSFPHPSAIHIHAHMQTLTFFMDAEKCSLFTFYIRFHGCRRKKISQKIPAQRFYFHRKSFKLWKRETFGVGRRMIWGCHCYFNIKFQLKVFSNFKNLFTFRFREDNENVAIFQKFVEVEK